jgi:DNA-binding PucR family transcriptional regulator
VRARHQPIKHTSPRVHPQTARYRMTRVRELFGESLDDPDQRFWLSVALRV